MEEEANYFALCLLMPEDQFLEAYIKFPLSPADDTNAVTIARMFQVTVTAVVLRAEMLREKIATITELIQAQKKAKHENKSKGISDGDAPER
jgi:Zn-dependent peptidase ImmA (M78 family)